MHDFEFRWFTGVLILLYVTAIAGSGYFALRPGMGKFFRVRRIYWAVVLAIILFGTFSLIDLFYHEIDSPLHYTFSSVVTMPGVFMATAGLLIKFPGFIRWRINGK